MAFGIGSIGGGCSLLPLSVALPSCYAALLWSLGCARRTIRAKFERPCPCATRATHKISLVCGLPRRATSENARSKKTIHEKRTNGGCKSNKSQREPTSHSSSVARGMMPHLPTLHARECIGCKIYKLHGMQHSCLCRVCSYGTAHSRLTTQSCHF